MELSMTLGTQLCFSKHTCLYTRAEMRKGTVLMGWDTAQQERM